MTGDTHTRGGIFLALIFLNLFASKLLTSYNWIYSLLLIVLFFAASSFGALFPDIDQKKSSISRKLPFLANTFGAKCRHRGFTHSLLCLGIFSLILAILSWACSFDIIVVSTSIGFICGYMSHLLFDLFTDAGIELFYPNKTNFKLGTIKTGSKVEQYLDKSLGFINVCLLVYNLYLLFNNTISKFFM